MNREQMILGEMPTVSSLARKISRKIGMRFDIEDLISSGYVALVGCFPGYDPSKGASFHTYASNRIYGGILDFLRSEDTLKQGRRNPANKGFGKNVQFTAEGDEDTESGMGTPRLSELPSSMTGIDQYQNTLQNEVMGLLTNSLVRRQSRKVFQMRFIENKTCSEVGKEMGITKNRVSNIVQDDLVAFRRLIAA